MQDFLNTGTQSVGWFKNRADNHELEISPPFQRNPVWQHPQKSLLMDSILRGYPIPEIYMQENTDESGNLAYVIVDGQQRIRACLEFVESGFEILGEESPEWAEMTFDDLSTEDKKRFFGYKFVTRVLPEMPNERLRAIFGRLNRNNLALNKQELRHSTYWGEFLSFVEEVSNQQCWGDWGVFTPNEVRRMLDREFISELAIGVLHGPQNKKLSLDKWYAAYEEDFDEKDELARTFYAVTGEIQQILPNLRTYRWRKKSDFYTLFLVLASFQSSFPLSAEKRDSARTRLIEFAQEVDAYLTHEGSGTKPITKHASAYAKAVQRAASDLNNRKTRADQLAAALALQTVAGGA